jgi:hypothetical protein
LHTCDSGVVRGGWLTAPKWALFTLLFPYFGFHHTHARTHTHTPIFHLNKFNLCIHIYIIVHDRLTSNYFTHAYVAYGEDWKTCIKTLNMISLIFFFINFFIYLFSQWAEFTSSYCYCRVSWADAPFHSVGWCSTSHNKFITYWVFDKTLITQKTLSIY